MMAIGVGAVNKSGQVLLRPAPLWPLLVAGTLFFISLVTVLENLGGAAAFPLQDTAAFCQTGQIDPADGPTLFYPDGASSPFSLILKAEFTDTVVSSVEAGKTYDVELSSAYDNLFYAGMFLRASEGSFMDLDLSDSENERGPYAYALGNFHTLACNGTALALRQEFYSQFNFWIADRAIKYAVTVDAAPQQDDFVLSLSALIMPWRFFESVTLTESTATLPDEFYAFYENFTFPITAPPTAAPVNVSLSTTKLVVCPGRAQPPVNCKHEHFDTWKGPDARVYSPRGMPISYISSWNTLTAVDAASNVVASVETGMGIGEFMHLYDGELIYCAIPFLTKRSSCRRFDPNTLQPTSDQWDATGVVARQQEIRSAYVITAGKVFSARFQSETKLVSKQIGNQAHVITMAEVDVASPQWAYTYWTTNPSRAVTNNGLLRSTFYRTDLWMKQPEWGRPPTDFLHAWTPSEEHPYVYFAYQEHIDADSAGRTRLPLIGRVCKVETTTPLAGENYFNSFTNIRIQFAEYSTDVSLDTMTAATSTVKDFPGLTPRFFVASKSLEEPTAFRQRVRISYLGYERSHEVDHEFAGLINPALADDLGITEPFTCDRSDTAALQLTRARNDASPFDNDRNGFLYDIPIFQQDASLNTSIISMDYAVVNVSDTSFLEVLWVLDSNGYVYKVPVPPFDNAVVPEPRPSTPVSSLQDKVDIIHPAAALTQADIAIATIQADTSVGAAFVTLQDRVLRIPFDRCERFTSCNTCVGSGDPYCGWCGASSTCTTHAACAEDVLQDVFGHDTSTCPVEPAPVDGLMFDEISHEHFALSWEAASEARPAASFETPQYLVLIDGAAQASPQFATSFSTMAPLLPFTQYNIEVRAINNGGYSSATVTGMTNEHLPSPVAALTGLNTTQVGATLVWKAPLTPNGVIVGYDVRRNGTRLCCSGESASSTTSFRDTDATPGSTYVYSVSAETSVGVGNDTQVIIRTREAAPSQPRNLVVLSATRDSVTLSWDVPAMPNGRLLSFLLVVGDSMYSVPSASFESFTYTVRGLASLTEYAATVAAQTSAGYGPFSSVVMATTLVSVPPALDPPILSQDTHGSIAIEWGTPAQFPLAYVEGYKVEISTNLTVWWTLFSGNSTQTTLGSTLPCTGYYVRVSVLSTTGDEGPMSSPAFLATTSGPVQEPSKRPLLKRTGGIVAASLAPPPNGECDFDGFAIQQRIDGGEWVQVCCDSSGDADGDTSRSPVQVFNITGRGVVVAYRYAYRHAHFGAPVTGSFSAVANVVIPEEEASACPETTASPPVTTSATTSDVAMSTCPPTGVDPNAPDKVAGVTAVGGVYNVSLSWEVPESVEMISGYHVFRDNLLVCCGSGGMDAADTSFVDVGLESGAQYSYRVRAISASGIGHLSDAVAATVLLAPPPVPSMPRFISSTTTSLAIAWTVPALDVVGDLDSVSVTLYSSASDAVVETAVINDVAVNEHMFSGLMPLTGYTARVVVETTQGRMSTSARSGVLYTHAVETTRPLSFAIIQFAVSGDYTPDLGDATSSSHMSLSASITEAVEAALSSLSGMQAFAVSSFEAGSIVVAGNLTTISGPPLQVVVNALSDAIDNGDLAAIDAIAGSLVRLADETCTSSGGGTTSGSTDATAGVAVGIGAGIALAAVVGIFTFFVTKRMYHEKKTRPKKHELVSFAADNPLHEGIGVMRRPSSSSLRAPMRTRSEPITEEGEGEALARQRPSTLSESIRGKDDYLIIGQEEEGANSTRQGGTRIIEAGNKIGEEEDEVVSGFDVFFRQLPPNQESARERDSRNSLMDTDEQVMEKLSSFNRAHTSDSMLSSVDFSSSRRPSTHSAMSNGRS